MSLIVVKRAIIIEGFIFRIVLPLAMQHLTAILNIF